MIGKKVRGTAAFWFLVFVMGFRSLGLQAQRISDSVEFSILTCDPGEELYSLFGHSAMRMKDKVRNVDVVFNYGLFSFSSDYFILKFAAGQTDYMLGSEYFRDFTRQYSYEQRTVKEQVLNLTGEQKQELYAFMLNNLKPKNREYRYNYFTNNCASKLRDVLNEATGNSVVWNEKDEKLTYRKLIKPYLAPFPWTKVGTDLLLGMPADTAVSSYAWMFLPDHLLDGFNDATLNGKSLVQSDEVIVKGAKRSESHFRPWNPFLVFLFVLLFVIWGTWQRLNGGKSIKAFDFVLFLILGIGGLLVLFISFFSVHPTVFPNFHILWFTPTHLVFAFALLKKKKPRWINYYVKVCGWLIFAVIVFNLVHIQRYHWTLLLLQAAIIIRLYAIHTPEKTNMELI